MSRSQLVAEHLPLLRRYARALTGNQASGDAYVAAMLETLLQDPSLLEGRDIGIVVERNRVPYSREQPEQAGARPMATLKQRGILEQRL